MSGKTESSHASKKGESAARKPVDKGQEGPSPDSAGFESILGKGQPGLSKLNSYLEGADKVTRARVVNQLQQSHGNSFIQRVMRQAEHREADTSPRSESTSAELDQQQKNWRKWQAAAKSGTKAAVTAWAMSARLKHVHINAQVAVGGRISGRFPSGLIQSMLAGQGAPANVSRAFAQATSAAWRWKRRATVPGLPWYPAFAAFPGPMAPPMPNIPTPLIVLASGAHISSGDVASDIMDSLGENASDEGAQDAVQSFADWLSLSFTIWLASSQVTLVMGKGPIPSFAPPYIPVGPVVMGTAESYGSFLTSAPPFGI
jgi:hypothetical protein